MPRSGKRSHAPVDAATQCAELLSHDTESFWDVGANIGFYSWLSQSLQPSVPVEAFEPDTRNAALMRMTMDRARIEGVTLHPIALGDQMGTAQFAFDDVSGLTGSVTTPDGIRLANMLYGCTRTADVAISTIDEIRSQRSRRVTLMKIDVEGHEAAVIRGGLQTLASDRPVILMECWSETYPAVAKLLASVNYSITEIFFVHFLARPC